MRYCNIIHRNLKPSKILFHKDHLEQKIYINDFKYAKKFKLAKKNSIKYTETYKL